MTNRQLAKLVLICTRTLIEIFVDCCGGPSNRADMERVVKSRRMLDEYLQLMSVKDVDGLMAVIGDVDGD